MHQNKMPKKLSQKELIPLLGYILSYSKVSERTLQHLAGKLQVKEIQKGDILQHAGEICDHIYFVSKGILRGYIIDNKKEVTTWITAENAMVASIKSFLLHVPTEENIAAIEDSRLMGIHYDDLQYMYDTFPDFNTAGRKITEYYYTHAEDRAFICRLSKATDRYNYFMRNNGHVINRVPLTYIASYLGIRLDSLSRVRKRIQHKK
jgi:CRP-like cAMP-binding protein